MERSDVKDLKKELEEIEKILHLTRHRNKNQHRLSKWWKSFSQLRRQISKLIVELEDLPGHPVSLKNQEKGKSRENKSESAAEKRVEFMKGWLVPRCYLAFSGLVADNQYAALGLMLMATLGRAGRVIGELGKVSGTGKVDMEGRKAENIESESVSVGLAGGKEEDLGEAVERGIVEGTGKGVINTGGEDGEDVSTQTKGKKKRRNTLAQEPKDRLVEATTTKPPKKKRKKLDAFDDLFDSLM